MFIVVFQGKLPDHREQKLYLRVVIVRFHAQYLTLDSQFKTYLDPNSTAKKNEFTFFFKNLLGVEGGNF